MLGYNEKRPNKENYEKFLREFTSKLRLSGFDKEGNSLMIYGSVARGNHIVGRSDIDAVLIYNKDVVTNKLDFMCDSNILSSCLKENYVPVQMTIADSTTMKDGRFFTYSAEFADHFKKDGKILLGPDYRKEMRMMKSKKGIEERIGFNLRKIRQKLFFSEFDKEKEYEKFLENFYKAIVSISSLPREIILLERGRFIPDRFERFTSFHLLFSSSLTGSIDTHPLRDICDLLSDPNHLDKTYKEPFKVLQIWKDGLTCYEEILREYIRKH